MAKIIDENSLRITFNPGGGTEEDPRICEVTYRISAEGISEKRAYHPTLTSKQELLVNGFTSDILKEIKDVENL